MRPRKLNVGLPQYVRIRNGSYLYRDNKLCRVSEGEARMYEALSKIKREASSDAIPAAVERFKKFHLHRLSPSSKKEHERYLDIFADEFSEFAVAQVEASDIRKSIANLYPDKHTAASAYKARISTFFQWVVNYSSLRKDNPCREIRLKKPRSKPMLWTRKLFWAVREKLDPMHQCYHDLSFLMYQRTTDIRNLMLSQIGETEIVFTPSKTHKSSGASVRVPITPEIKEVLERAEGITKAQAKKSNRIVPREHVIHARDGEPFTRSGIYSAYLRADMALHDDKPIGLNPKALLRFACQEAEIQGHTLRQIQIGRAHTDIKTTQGYLRIDAVPVSEVVMKLPAKG